MWGTQAPQELTLAMPLLSVPLLPLSEDAIAPPTELSLYPIILPKLEFQEPTLFVLNLASVPNVIGNPMSLIGKFSCVLVFS